MKISLIVAAAENNAIGKDNQLLWHLPNDLKFFKNTTWGMPVIMGRKTYESFNKPLPGRYNIVITRQAGWTGDGAVAVSNLNAAMTKAAETNCREIFVIGGGEIYQQAFSLAEKIYLTRVNATLEADTFFPALDENDWQLVSSQEHAADEKHKYAYSFQTWERIKK